MPKALPVLSAPSVLALLALAALPCALSAPSASITGNASLVYSFYASHCPPLPQPGCSTDIDPGCDCDIADAPLRMWRRSGGDNLTFSLASVDLGSRALLGASPLALQHQCSLYANSSRTQAFSQYANYEWVHSSWYFASNNSVVALTHMEWDCKSAATCAFWGLGYSFFSAVTLMQSLNGGDTWAHALPPPAHLVAASPVAWTEALGAAGQAYGFRSPSSIVAGRLGLAGFYFATVTAGWGNGAFQGQQQGACMMRTRDLTDPTAWLAWGGADFDVPLWASPYGTAANPTAAARPPPCQPFTNITYASLLWSSLHQAYMYFGTAAGDDHGGWQYLLSTDLRSWGAPVAVATGGHINPAGNASVTPSGAPFTGRFVQRQDHPGDPQVWWEDAAHRVRRRVGSCTPCPGLSACGSALVPIPDAEFDALQEAGAYTCSWQYNATGYSDFYYPTLVDPASASENYDEVGASANLFLVAQACVGVDGSGACTPFDDSGLLVRDVIQVPVQFTA
jgi:hypothetical protein